ncbi:MAG: hypothetical protein ACR2QG_12660 [Gammaproteobacteria bacterium]
MQRKFLFGLILLVMNLAFLEVISFSIGNWFIPNRVIFNPSFSDEAIDKLLRSYEKYLEIRDPITGWPLKDRIGDPEKRLQERYDEIGSRYIPAFKDPSIHKACVSLFGDSFTYSSEVDDEYAWSNVLSEKLNCRVNNFGAGGFGSDQAYLRFESYPSRPPVVFLNHLSENIIRNSTQFRAMVLGYDRSKKNYSFKPKFIIDDTGELQYIRLPQIKVEDYIDALYNPGEYLPYDFFLPGGESGINRLEFPYTWTLIKTLNHYHVKAKLLGLSWYTPFYETDHPADGLRVTAGIMLRFKELALERGQQPVLTVIPTGQDLEHYNEHGVWPYQNLLDLLQENNADVVNFGEGLMQRVGDGDPCDLFDSCKNHFNEQGYEYLAEIAYETIQDRKLSLE